MALSAFVAVCFTHDFEVLVKWIFFNCFVLVDVNSYKTNAANTFAFQHCFVGHIKRIVAYYDIYGR